MRDVKLVRLSDDGTHVVLTHEGTGEEFALRIDDRLRGFVTSDRARVAQLPVERPSRLSPKEIQARLRAGESSEDIAAAADVSLERVMRYAGPVLAEREYLTEQAQTALLRRPPGSSQNGGQSRALGSTVTERLEALGTNTGQIRWDAWRMADGRWAVAVYYHLPGTTEEAQATFGFDPVGRTVVPIDEAGEWILGERTTQQQQSTTVEGPAPRTPREARPRLAAVPPPAGDPMGERETEPAEHEPVVRSLRPTHTPESTAPPSAATPEAEHSQHSGSGDSTSGPPDDRIAYEPTVDLSRSMHDQPQPDQRAPEQHPASSTQTTGGQTNASRHVEPSSVRQPEHPEPPRLSTADLPDLGESTNLVPAPADPDTRSDLVHQVGGEEQSPLVGRTQLPERQPEPGEALASDLAASPESDTTAADTVAFDDADPASAQPRGDVEQSVTEKPVMPVTVATIAIPEPEAATQPSEAEPSREDSAPAADVVSSGDAPVPAEAMAHVDATADPAHRTDSTGTTGAQPAAEGEHDGTLAHVGHEQTTDEATSTSTQNGAVDQAAEKSNDSKDGGDNSNGAAGKKSLGQDRRTSGNRRRRAAGSRRKGAVPSWDDILFGGDSKKD